MKNIKATKRSMFITTLLIVVLLIAAVSTATWAWFTAQTTATAVGSQITAATADASNLGIGWDVTEAQSGTNSEIEFAPNAGALKPMAPVSSPTVASTNLSVFAFNEAYVDTSGVFTSAGRTVSPATLGALSPATGSVIHLANNAATGGTPIAGITMTMPALTVVDAGPGTAIPTNAVRVAVFVSTTGAAGDFLYRGTLGEGATRFGAITGSPQTAVSLSTFDASDEVQLLAGPLAPGGVIHVQLRAWFDGHLLTNPNAGGTVGMSFTFEAGAGA